MRRNIDKIRRGGKKIFKRARKRVNEIRKKPSCKKSHYQALESIPQPKPKTNQNECEDLVREKKRKVQQLSPG